MVCRAWVDQGYGTPLAVFVLYALKVAAYAAGFLVIAWWTPALGTPLEIGSWFTHPTAITKALVWSLLFEVLGFGCGSGPLTARYLPPAAAFLHFLRPGTVRLPPWPSLPGTGGTRRSGFDVLLHAGLLVACGWALAAPGPGRVHLLTIIVLVGVAGLRDKTIFLAARGEHMVVGLGLIVLAPDPDAVVAGLMGLWGALWFFAGVSKLNHHFATVVAVMTSNSPLLPFRAPRRWMVRAFPDDLRPSTLATLLGHAGTAIELAVPLVLVAGMGHAMPLGIGLMLYLHAYITLNVPMGVPLEWNVLMVFGALALFLGHPDVTVLDMGMGQAVLLLSASVVVPVLGNLLPGHVSFLPSMRYYAGNWAMSVWFFRGDAHEKLARVPKAAPWVADQLGVLYDDSTVAGLLSKVMAFRLMHLHGRALGLLLPQALDGELADHTWMDGEVVAGLTLGWNFGDGHLHGAQLVEALQERCGFAPGEVRVIAVESQPLFGRGHAWRILDASTGELAAGEVDVQTLRARQPWDLGPGDGHGAEVGTGARR